MRYLLMSVLLLASLGQADAQPSQFKTSVKPHPTDNLAGPCAFDLNIPAPQKPVRAVWITYDRGYDISRYYNDPEVVAFADKHAIALMLAHQCPAKSPPTLEQGEMDMDPSHGIGQSIFTGLDNFAQQSGHPELASSKLIVLGFSGTGALFAHFVRYAPDRVLAAILTNPGQSEPYGMNQIDLPTEALVVPQFIIAGATDDRAGTELPYGYFRRHRERGAPWIFLVQNGIGHCCVINAKALILEWLNEVIKLREPSTSKPLRKMGGRKGWIGFIRPCEAVQRDGKGQLLWRVCGASVQPADHTAPDDEQVSGWFPTRKLAQDWLAFIQQQQHPANSFPN
jgi:dienelactone hydrolase